jgi:TolB protein
MVFTQSHGRTAMNAIAKSLIVVVVAAHAACDRDSGSVCPVNDVAISPYENPVWHPGGDLIGFNHTPVQSVRYFDPAGCPRMTTYTYKEDSAGFWLISRGGSNKRRVLPYYLYSPSWSPDGKWIAYMNDAQIFKMAFNGSEFDEASKVQLTSEGRNFFPAWSPDNQMIAYDNTVCGSAATPIPPNSCGVLTIGADGDGRTFIGAGRMPYWRHCNQYLYVGGDRINLADGERVHIFDPVTEHVSIYDPPSFNPRADQIAFIGTHTNTPTQYLMLFSVNADGTGLKTITDLKIKAFAWSPAGEIVYLKFDGSHVDETGGTLWTMDSNGDNRRQITFNKFTTE